MGLTCATPAGHGCAAAGRDALPTRLTALKRYRAIDRRFDGPKHRRTRDYGDYGWW